MLPDNPSELLKAVYLGNTVKAYLTAFGVAILIYLALLITKQVILGKVKKLTKYSKRKYDDIIIDTLRHVTSVELTVLAIYFATMSLVLDKTTSFFVMTVVTIVLTFRAILLLQRLIIEAIISRARGGDDELSAERESAAKTIGIVVKAALWSVGLLFILNNMGVNITAAVAGLGVGGVAVALAAQSVLGDAFSSFAIYLDKPFVVGDFIIVDNYLGVVEHVGIKTTRIKSLQGEQLVFSNTDLTKSRIQNFKKMAQRRVPFTIGVTYQTPAEKLKKIPVIIKKIIDDMENATFDRAHFKAYGDFSLNFEIVYYVLASDYNVYMDIQQAMNLAVYEAFEKEGIEFAYPTQTLYVNKGE